MVVPLNLLRGCVNDVIGELRHLPQQLEEPAQLLRSHHETSLHFMPRARVREWLPPPPPHLLGHLRSPVSRSYC